MTVDGEPAVVGACAFDLLLALVERRDRVMPKSELLDLVWPGLVVEENNLQVQVSALRKLLSAAAIVTVAGRGYRFRELDSPRVLAGVACNYARLLLGSGDREGGRTHLLESLGVAQPHGSRGMDHHLLEVAAGLASLRDEAERRACMAPPWPDWVNRAPARAGRRGFRGPDDGSGPRRLGRGGLRRRRACGPVAAPGSGDGRAPGLARCAGLKEFL